GVDLRSAEPRRSEYHVMGNRRRRREIQLDETLPVYGRPQIEIIVDRRRDNDLNLPGPQRLVDGALVGVIGDAAGVRRQFESEIVKWTVDIARHDADAPFRMGDDVVEALHRCRHVGRGYHYVFPAEVGNEIGELSPGFGANAAVGHVERARFQFLPNLNTRFDADLEHTP